jgi:hypothetical protein
VGRSPVCRNAVYMIASKCRPENFPGSDFRLYFSSESLISRPPRPRMAISSAMAWDPAAARASPSTLAQRSGPSKARRTPLEAGDVTHWFWISLLSRYDDRVSSSFAKRLVSVNLTVHAP